MRTIQPRSLHAETGRWMLCRNGIGFLFFNQSGKCRCLRAARDVPVAEVEVLDPARRELLRVPPLMLPIELLRKPAAANRHSGCIGILITPPTVRVCASACLCVCVCVCARVCISACVSVRACSGPRVCVAVRCVCVCVVSTAAWEGYATVPQYSECSRHCTRAWIVHAAARLLATDVVWRCRVHASSIRRAAS